MSCHKRISKDFEKALSLPLNLQTKYIVFSDCHRGTGRANDNFTQNEVLYLAALRHYYQCGFTYLELGDGDELWENRSMKKIKETHGHQVSIMNSTFWEINRFLVRYLWKNLELVGVPDPAGAAKNHTKKREAEKFFTEWAQENNGILITGHTHHPMAGSKESPYFNTGSCIHPIAITGIEIENRCISLVKWSLGTRKDQTVYVKREILGKSVCIDEYITVQPSVKCEDF